MKADARTNPTRRIAVILAIIALFTCAFAAGSLAQPTQAHAAALTISADDEPSAWRLSQDAVTIKDYNQPVMVYLQNYDGWTPDVDSSDEDIVSVSASWDSDEGAYAVSLTKTGVGKAQVRVYDDEGDQSRIISVTCKPTDFKLNYGNFTFSKKSCWTALTNSAKYENGHASDCYIKKAVSSKKSVATVKVIKNKDSAGKIYSYATITPKKTGKTKITYTDQYNRKITRTITVSKKYWAANLKSCTYAYSYYGTKEATVYSKPRATVTIKIGSERHTKKTDKNGKAVFKLKKLYKKGTTIKVRAKTSNATGSVSAKIGSNSYCNFNGKIWSCKYYVPVRVSNVHKGDYLVIQSGSERHYRTFYSDYKNYAFDFYMNSTLRNYRFLSLTLMNKYDQQLSYTSWNIKW